MKTLSNYLFENNYKSMIETGIPGAKVSGNTVSIDMLNLQFSSRDGDGVSADDVKLKELCDSGFKFDCDITLHMGFRPGQTSDNLKNKLSELNITGNDHSLYIENYSMGDAKPIVKFIDDGSAFKSFNVGILQSRSQWLAPAQTPKFLTQLNDVSKQIKTLWTSVPDTVKFELYDELRNMDFETMIFAISKRMKKSLDKIIEKEDPKHLPFINFIKNLVKNNPKSRIVIDLRGERLGMWLMSLENGKLKYQEFQD